MEAKESEILIPSDTVRKYISETGYTFTDWQIASILHLRDYPETAVRESMRSLEETADDLSLKEQLTVYLTREDMAYQMLKENPDRDFIYIVTYKEDADTEEMSYFFDYESALRYGMGTKVAFRVEKHLVCDEKVMDQFDDGEYRDYAFATICYDENGKIDYFDSIELPEAGWNTGIEWHDWFGHMFYEVPNPFERGDIVKVVGSEDYGIVETSQADWKKDLERSKSPEEKLHMDHSDVQLRVVFPDDNARFYHEHINPVFLERCGLSDNPEDKELNDLLLCISEFYKGKGSIEDAQYYQEQYRKAKGYDD